MASALLLPAVVALRGAEVTSVAAQSTAAPPLCTGIQLQNTSTSTGAQVTVNFFKVGSNDANADFSFNDTVGANGSKSYFLPTSAQTSGLPDGQYSVVVNSDQPLNALVNQQTCPNNPGAPAVAASFSGIGSGDIGSPIYLPFVLSRAFGTQQWASYLAIQNAGSADASDVKIDFYQTGSSTPTTSVSFAGALKSQETWYVNLRTGSIADQLANAGFTSGSAIVTAGQPLAAVVNYSPGDNSRLLSYNGVKGGGTNLFVPQFTRSFAGGYEAGLTVVNTGADTTVNIRFVGTARPAGQANRSAFDNTIQRSLPANGTLVVFSGNMSDSELAPEFNGTAIVSASSPLVGIFNIDFRGTPPPGTTNNNSEAANMIPSTQGAQVIYFPQMAKQFGNAGGGASFTAGWQLVNMTGSDVTGTADYFTASSSSPVATQNITVPANGSLTNFLGNPASDVVPIGFNGGVVIRVNGNVGGQGNFSGYTPVARSGGGFDYVLANGDTLLIYNGFPGQ